MPLRDPWFLTIACYHSINKSSCQNQLRKLSLFFLRADMPLNHIFQWLFHLGWRPKQHWTLQNYFFMKVLREQNHLKKGGMLPNLHPCSPKQKKTLTQVSLELYHIWTQERGHPPQPGKQWVRLSRKADVPTSLRVLVFKPTPRWLRALSSTVCS